MAAFLLAKGRRGVLSSVFLARCRGSRLWLSRRDMLNSNVMHTVVLGP